VGTICRVDLDYWDFLLQAQEVLYVLGSINLDFPLLCLAMQAGSVWDVNRWACKK
jgi:hypothetical protein